MMTPLGRRTLQWSAPTPGPGVSLPVSLPVHLPAVTQSSVRVLDRKYRRLGHRLDSEFVSLADYCAAAYSECSQVTLHLTHLTHICDKTHKLKDRSRNNRNTNQRPDNNNLHAYKHCNVLNILNKEIFKYLIVHLKSIHI